MEYLKPGNILYFPNFQFKNGGSKDKFLLVVKELEDVGLILASLPSSVDHVPSEFDGHEGCLDFPERHFNCFVISPEVPITECETFSFSKKTHLYGENLDDYPVGHFEDYVLEGFDYYVKGKLKPELFEEVIDCFRRSSNVKRWIKRLL